jgi:beta-barrel assembly-enhancing protease
MPSDIASQYFPATFSDGQTAHGATTHVELGPGELRIIESGTELAAWPYASLHAATPMSRRSQDVLLTSTAQPGATVFVASAAFAFYLQARAPHLGAGAERWRTARVWIAAGVSVFALVGGLWWLDVSPARSLANLMPDTVRAKLGQQVIGSMTRDYAVCTSAAGLAALDKMSDRLSVAAGNNAKFKIIVVNWKLLNAFAAPGEQIVLTRELVENAKGPDEIAGVLAHEMGHGLERHPETGMIRIVGLSAALEFMMGGGGSTVANIGLLLAQLSYTRVAEQEADDHSLRILNNAGISPRGIGDFFKRVEKVEGGSTVGRTIGKYDILRTHPQSAERAKRALEQKDYPTTPALGDDDWQALRQICSGGGTAKPAP